MQNTLNSWKKQILAYFYRDPIRVVAAFVLSNIAFNLVPSGFNGRLLCAIIVYFIIENTLKEKTMLIPMIAIVLLAAVFSIAGNLNLAHDLAIFAVQLGLTVVVISVLKALVGKLFRGAYRLEP